MMTEQEDEEEKVKWRVDAEVRLALEEFKAAESERAAGTQGATCVGFPTDAAYSLCALWKYERTSPDRTLSEHELHEQHRI